MTSDEERWRVSESANELMGYITKYKVRVSNRKLRLYLVALCRIIWPVISDDRGSSAVGIAERYADGLCHKDLMRLISSDVTDWRHGLGYGPNRMAPVISLIQDSLGPDDKLMGSVKIAVAMADTILLPGILASKTQARLLRDLLGNPYLTCPLDSLHLTPTATSLAQAAYNDRFLPSGCLDPVRLAILADALEEAGCVYEPILNHLRDNNHIHMRGCWAIDLILGKK